MIKRDRFGRDVKKFRDYQREYMREYRKRKKVEAAKDKAELETFRGVTFPVSVVEEQMRKRGVAVATDSAVRRSARALPRTDEEYEAYMREFQAVPEEPQEVASDSLGITGREATDLERCMSLRMDIYGEDEVTARRTCSAMFNDEYYRKVFAEGDGWKMGEALHKWDLAHSPKWTWYRELKSIEERQREKEIDKIVKEIRSDASDPMHLLSEQDSELRARAERTYRIRKAQAKRQRRRVELESKLTVGDVYGKTKEEIIREQHETRGKQRLTVGDLTQRDYAYPQEHQYRKYLPGFVECVRQRMKDGMTREQAEAHCLVATLPEDQPTPASKVKK